MMAHSPRLDSVLSFSHAAADPAQPTHQDRVEDVAAASSDDDDDEAGGSGFEFEFAFAPPLDAGRSGGGIADELFAHGRILPAYPVFDRQLVQADGATASTAPPSPDTDTYCPWVPRSAPGSPARDPFHKSASTGEARRWRLRDLVGSTAAAGRSHSDGKEKFVFLHPSPKPRPQQRSSSISTTPAAEQNRAKKTPPSPKAQGGKKKAVTEMDMATAHRLFYGGDRKQQASYLPYRPGIVGFFANVHALGRSHHHPY